MRPIVYRWASHLKRVLVSTACSFRWRLDGSRCPAAGNPQLIMVDEATAGLGLEERNRFNNLIAEIGQSIVVFLPAHLVDGVADLCSQMAIINGGRLRAGGRGTSGSLLRGPALGKTAGSHQCRNFALGMARSGHFTKTL